MRLIIVALSLIFAACSAQGQTLIARCVGVTDGDTITLLTLDKQPLKVRLQGIDTPESKQPFGQRAKQALSDLIFSRDVVLTVTGKDRYGRTLGDVHLGELWINLGLGMALHEIQ